MALQIKKESASYGVQVWQIVHETAQGGFTLDVTGLTLGATLATGTPFTFDESTRMAKPLKTVEVVENAVGSATAYKVKKGSLLAVGDIIGAVVGGKAYAITSIDASGNNTYDTVNVGTSIGAVAAGESVFQSSASGATAAALSITPKGLLYESRIVEKGADVAVVLRGTIYARRAPGAAADVKSKMPLIVYSQSF